VVEGLDVSEWQGSIDWAAVRNSGRAFAFIRASDGLGHTDGTFASNWPSARAAGVTRGAYQYFRPSEDPVAQADLFLQLMGPPLPGDLPPALDVEITGGLAAPDLRAAVDAWSSRIGSALGRPPIVYASPGFWSQVGGGADADPLWEADWTSGCPSLPSSWSAWTFWQYSDAGSVEGISGTTDLDRFNGSLSSLRAFAAAAGSSAMNPSLPVPPTTCPSGDGLYCGGDGVLGISSSLYGCAAGALTLIQACPNGCKWMPAGVDDACQ